MEGIFKLSKDSLSYCINFLDYDHIRVLLQSSKFKSIRADRLLLSIFNFLNHLKIEDIIFRKDFKIASNTLYYLKIFSEIVVSKFNINTHSAMEHIYRYLRYTIKFSKLVLILTSWKSTPWNFFDEFCIHFQDKIEILLEFKNTPEKRPIIFPFTLNIPKNIPVILRIGKFLTKETVKDLEVFLKYGCSLRRFYVKYDIRNHVKWQDMLFDLVIENYLKYPNTLNKLRLTLLSGITEKNFDQVFQILYYNIESIKIIHIKKQDYLERGIKVDKRCIFRILSFLQKNAREKEIELRYSADTLPEILFYHFSNLRDNLGKIKLTLNISSLQINIWSHALLDLKAFPTSFEILFNGRKSLLHYLTDTQLQSLNYFRSIKVTFNIDHSQTAFFCCKQLCKLLQSQRQLEEVILYDNKSSQNSGIILRTIVETISQLKIQSLKFINEKENYEFYKNLNFSILKYIPNFSVKTIRGKVSLRNAKKTFKVKVFTGTDEMFSIAEEYLKNNSNEALILKIKRINDHFDVKAIDDSILRKYPSVRKSISEIYLQGTGYDCEDMNSIFMKMIFFFLILCQNLRSLKIKAFEAYKNDWNIFANIIQNFSMLERLRIKSCNVEDEEMKNILVAIKSRTIRHLKIQAGLETLKKLYCIFPVQFPSLSVLHLYLHSDPEEECKELAKMIIDQGKTFWLIKSKINWKC